MLFLRRDSSQFAAGAEGSIEHRRVEVREITERVCGTDACRTVLLLVRAIVFSPGLSVGVSLLTNGPVSRAIYKSTLLRCCTSRINSVARMQQATPRCQSFLLINRSEIAVRPSDNPPGFELIARSGGKGEVKRDHGSPRNA